MTADSPPGPRADYQRRLAERQRQLDVHQRRALLLARVVAGLVLLWLALAYVSCDRHAAARTWLLLPAIMVVACAWARGRVLAAAARAERAAVFYRRGLARIDDTWSEDPVFDQGLRFADPSHLYANDLDLFGKGSLFALLSTATTPIGQETLAAWLKAPAEPDEVRARQAAVAELAPRLDLREDLAVRGLIVKDEVEEASLLAWAETPAGRLPWAARFRAFALGLLGAAATALLVVGHVLPGLLGLAAVALLSAPVRAAIADLDRGLARRTDELRVVSALVARLESERFEAPLLAELHAGLAAEGMAASRRIAQLARLVGWYESRRNAFYAILVAPLLLPTQLGLAIHRWRARFGPAVARWLRVVGTVEALASLAAWRLEHPGFPFPRLTPDQDGPLLDGEALGHPLIPATRRVANDVRLGGVGRLLLVSGSNMSGKSTYLRTVGINVVLAMAGAPVCAHRLALSRLVLGATLRINDSLQGGQSRFFAEITRIKETMVLARRSPFTLALLDEMLAGTNSQDRFAGARGVLQALLAAGALAIVTTHDLALARLADELAPAAVNVHFEDRIEDGRLLFDYRMRDGVVTRSNALDLMRLVGLDV